MMVQVMMMMVVAKFVECAHNRETVEGDEALSRNGNWGPGCKRAPQKGTRNFTRWKYQRNIVSLAIEIGNQVLKWL